ncbi:hypothetical protein EYF80_025793 [Liparis tanakae]|uniref:Uncharacterized protein n=1 Tax=Liparis tanakae TaxID=230148 RepID=A0A4Z2HEB3_9TELE|nr:hypothetical protein EYF80_025793 [Liparis tanakae]
MSALTSRLFMNHIFYDVELLNPGGTQVQQHQHRAEGKLLRGEADEANTEPLGQQGTKQETTSIET